MPNTWLHPAGICDVKIFLPIPSRPHLPISTGVPNLQKIAYRSAPSSILGAVTIQPMFGSWAVHYATMLIHNREREMPRGKKQIVLILICGSARRVPNHG